MIDILGNPTKISTPGSYAIAMSCIYEVVEILVDAEEKQPLKGRNFTENSLKTSGGAYSHYESLFTLVNRSLHL